MREYTIIPLTVGANETDQGIMTYLKGYGQRIWIPIYVFVIKGAEENILVDTGLEEFMVPEDFEEKFGFKVMEFEEALSSAGLAPEDVDVIIHTHLHNDHCENDYLCKNARVYVQKKELEFMREPHPIDHRYFPDVLDGVREIVELEGAAEIMDGISVVFTPGHTPGGQSVVVNTSEGKAVITGFCCNDKNFPEKGPVVCPGVHTDAMAALDSINRVKELADIIIPVHDLSVGRRSSIP